MLDLDNVRTTVEREMDRVGCPGLAVAVVADGEVALLEGFGVANTDTRAEVSADTAFGIASDSKAFTAALLCLLETDGALDLDEPLTSYIPWFTLADPQASALVTTRDLLCHRTGLPRHDLVALSLDDSIGMEDVARAFAHLQPSQPFRQTWQYCNPAYDVAGYVTEVVSETPWRQGIRERLFAPLGMNASGFDPVAMSAGDFAFPYSLKDGRHVREPLVRDTRLGPAGGIVTTANDLVPWLLARLGQDESRVLPDEVLTRLHAPCVVQPATVADERHPMGYALGCKVASYRGLRIVTHGGSLPGYSSEVLVCPDAGVGVAVLTNLNVTLAAEALSLMLLDTFVGRDPLPWGERRQALLEEALANHQAELDALPTAVQGRGPRRSLDEIVGSYKHPGYGELSLFERDGALAAEFHGFGETLTMVHLDGDDWHLVFDVGFTFPLNVGIDVVTVAFEPAVAPIEFHR